MALNDKEDYACFLNQLSHVENVDAVRNAFGITALTLGYVLYGYLSERFNAGLVLMIGFLLLAIMSIVFYQQNLQTTVHINVFYALCGLSVGIVGAAQGLCI